MIAKRFGQVKSQKQFPLTVALFFSLTLVITFGNSSGGCYLGNKEAVG
jgi:hypothetical protein